MKPATEILLSAAFVLTPEENWWGRGRVHKDGQSCVYVAISEVRRAMYGDKDGYDALDAAIEKLRKVIAPHPMFEWNDSRKRTHAEVLDALYRAAELSEASNG
jgi:hypothetical protein